MDVSYLRGNLTQWFNENDEVKPLVAIMGLDACTTLEGSLLDERELSLRQHFREALSSVSSSTSPPIIPRYLFYSTDEELVSRPFSSSLKNKNDDEEERPSSHQFKEDYRKTEIDTLQNDGERTKQAQSDEEGKNIKQIGGNIVPSSDIIGKRDHEEMIIPSSLPPADTVISSASEILDTQAPNEPPEDLLPQAYTMYPNREGTELRDIPEKSSSVGSSMDPPHSYTIMESDWMWKLQYQQPSIILNVVFVRDRSIEHEQAFAIRFVDKKRVWESSGTCRYLLLWIKLIDNPLENLHEEMEDRMMFFRKLTRIIQWNVDVMSLVATSHSDVNDQVQDIVSIVFDQSVVVYRSLIDRFKKSLKDLSISYGKSLSLVTRIVTRCHQISFGWKIAFLYEGCADPKMALKVYSTTYQDCLTFSQMLYDRSTLMDENLLEVDQMALTVQLQFVTEALFRRSVLLAFRSSGITSSLIPYNSLPDFCHQYIGFCREYFNRVLDVHQCPDWLFILHGWLARQYVWIADFIDIFSKNNINRESRDLQGLIDTYNSVQHEGHLWLLAVFHIHSRKHVYFEFKNMDLSTRINEQDNLEEPSLPTYEMHHVGKITPPTNSSFGKYAERELLFRIALHEERQFDHDNLILDTLTKAYESFHKRHPSPRMLLYVAYYVGKTYLAMGEWEIAIRFFEKILRTYRSEKWSSLLTEIWLLFRETSRSLPNLRKLSLEARLALSSEHAILDTETKELEFRALFPPSQTETVTDQSGYLAPIEISFMSGYDLIDSRVSFSFEAQKNGSSTLLQVGDEVSVHFACYSSAPLPFFLQSACLIFTYLTEVERHSVTFELQHYDEKSLREDGTDEVDVSKKCPQHAPVHIHKAYLTLPPKQWHLIKFSLPLEFFGKLQVS